MKISSSFKLIEYLRRKKSPLKLSWNFQGKKTAYIFSLLKDV